MNERELTLANLWCKHGCPERMKIQVPKTGEIIILLNGLPVTDNCVCKTCLSAFYSKRADAKYCSARCRQKAKREESAQRQRAEQELLLAGTADDKPAA